MKGSAVMDNLGETLMEELNCETVFTIGNIDISEAVVVTWIIMAFFVVVDRKSTRLNSSHMA